jgi:hypothetical protein
LCSFHLGGLTLLGAVRDGAGPRAARRIWLEIGLRRSPVNRIASSSTDVSAC